MTWVRATDVLREEHQSIKKVVASMAVLLIKLETGKEVNPETVEAVVDFMKLAGEIHERKEEKFLFPIMEKKGVSTSIAPVGLLVRNHQKAREMAGKLAAAASANAVGWLPMDSPIVESLQDLTDLYPPHFWQEEMLVYRVADQQLGEEDDRQLLEAFREFDGAEADVHARMREMANRIDGAVW